MGLAISTACGGRPLQEAVSHIRHPQPPKKGQDRPLPHVPLLLNFPKDLSKPGKNLHRLSKLATSAMNSSSLVFMLEVHHHKALCRCQGCWKHAFVSNCLANSHIGIEARESATTMLREECMACSAHLHGSKPGDDRRRLRKLELTL